MLRRSVRDRVERTIFTVEEFARDSIWKDPAGAIDIPSNVRIHDGDASNEEDIMTEVNQDVAMTKKETDGTSFCASTMSSTDSPAEAKNLLHQFKHLNGCEGYTCTCNPDEKKSYPRATHNLPSPIDDCERLDKYRTIVCYSNYVSLHMERNSYLLFKDQDEPSPVMLDYMLTEVRDSIIPRSKHELDSLDWDFSSPTDEKETPRLNDDVRDNLVQIGALLMMSGSYLIKMASEHCDDEYVNAAHHHLFKLLMRRNRGFCDMCGHKDCFNEEGSDPGMCGV